MSESEYLRTKFVKSQNVQFTDVNKQFRDKPNKVSGHYGRAWINNPNGIQQF